MSIIVSSDRIKRNIAWIGKHVNSPEQRLLLGATALATQPFIDYKNEDVDDKTRMISVARTLGKIIAGTLVGVAVRHLSIETVRKYSKCVLEKDVQGLITGVKKADKKQIFAPFFSNKIRMDEAAFIESYDTYLKGLGTIVATVAMIVTNFAVDAPLTRVLTRTFHKYITKYEDQKKQEVKK